MSHIHPKPIFYSPTKIKYFSPKIWRLMYLVASSSVNQVTKKRILSRGSCIPIIFKGEEALIHSGKKFSVRKISTWCIGFKFGEFTWNRKVAVYKAKQKKKKKK